MKNRVKIVLAMFLFITLCIGILSGLRYWIVSNMNSEAVRDVTQYGEFGDYHGYGNLYVFPKSISPKTRGAEYYFFDKDTLMEPTCQIFLSCEYDEETFRSELERISKITYEINGKQKNINYSENALAYPAYIAMYDWNDCYEYALIDKEKNIIIYVYLQGIIEPLISFERKYSPFENISADENILQYSMYSDDGYFVREEF